jgi:asparagine synthase (glutamine-hydrolysing)
VGGIAGIVHYRGDPPEREVAQQLSAGVAHRGPDDKGLFYEAPAALVQRVYSTSTSTHHAPRVGDRYVVLLDGPADLDRLEEAWTAHGAQCLADIKGGFAVAVWDRLERVLWLARDAAGTRPMYLAHQSPKFAFASCVAPLLGLSFVSREIATDQIAEYLSFRYVHAPRTLLRDVIQLPPGHLARVDSSGVRVDRWWSPQWAPAGAPPTEPSVTTDRFDAALRRATERRLRTEAPTGVLLSGGLDSTAILFHALRAKATPLIAYTATVNGDPADESAFAARVAGVLKAEHRIVAIDNADFIAAIEPATLAMGHPLPNPAALTQFLLFQEIRTDVRVLLSGAGGDELLAGRGMPQLAKRLRRTRMVGRLPGPTRQLGRRLARAGGFKDLASPQMDFGLARKIGGSRVFDAEERVQLLGDPAMARPGIRHSLLEPFYQEMSSDPINEILHVWQRGWLSEDILARGERLAARNGIQMRYPLLDTEILSLTASIPGPDKLQRQGLDYVGKAHIRRALADRVPKQIIERPKRSMPSPMGAWLRGPGAELMRDRIDALCDDPSALFVPTSIRRYAREHQEGTADHAVKLWTLILLGAWLRLR